jgi:hypothetical protein
MRKERGGKSHEGRERVVDGGSQLGITHQYHIIPHRCTYPYHPFQPTNTPYINHKVRVTWTSKDTRRPVLQWRALSPSSPTSDEATQAAPAPAPAPAAVAPPRLKKTEQGQRVAVVATTPGGSPVALSPSLRGLGGGAGAGQEEGGRRSVDGGGAAGDGGGDDKAESFALAAEGEGAMQEEAPAVSVTYTREDLCGAPAATIGFHDPGACMRVCIYGYMWLDLGGGGHVRVCMRTPLIDRGLDRDQSRLIHFITSMVDTHTHCAWCIALRAPTDRQARSTRR